MLSKYGSRIGPSGANVFVYHIPSDMDDEGLQKLFSPFGMILSTKVKEVLTSYLQVYRDKATKESRGFGFVSFSTVVEAEKAIQQMNGYLINGKHLKVQKKKEKYVSWSYSAIHDNSIDLFNQPLFPSILIPAKIKYYLMWIWKFVILLWV